MPISELKNCPFCGSKANLFHSGAAYWGTCTNEECECETPGRTDPEEAAWIWNRRAAQTIPTSPSDAERHERAVPDIVAQLGGKPEDLRNVLCGVVEILGIEAAAQITGYALKHRGMNAFDGSPAAPPPPAAVQEAVAVKAVAWRCKDFADGWILDASERSAREYQKQTGCLMQPLYAEPPSISVIVDNISDEQLRHISDSKDTAVCRSRIRSALSPSQTDHSHEIAALREENANIAFPSSHVGPSCEAIAKLLWERFSPDHEDEWPSTHASEYRLAAEDILNLLDRNAARQKAADLLHSNWSSFCDADAFPGSDTFADVMEAAGYLELVPVTKEALEDAFAAERGIEPGGMMYRLTDAGRSALQHVAKGESAALAPRQEEAK